MVALELLHEMVPNARRFAVLVFPGANAEFLINDAQAAAASMGRQIEVCTATTSRQMDTAFTSVVQKGGRRAVGRPVCFFLRAPSANCHARGSSCRTSALFEPSVR
jgi:putative tryptophan/tyrosine transport system substrate-binding protein